jgi:3-hydroxyacyl-CoA dehydrogenase/3a,7a,12a-trihydroxy-5b-cholest-24-enoyl-CoA hydratase
MSIDPGIEGFEYPLIRRAYDARETILYALAVGAGAHEDELQLVYEDGLVALPTFPVITPFDAMAQMESALGLDFTKVVHGEQRLRLHRPVPTAGDLLVRVRVSKVWDKAPHAIIDTTADVEVDGEHVATTTFSSFVRDGGGFGGERGTGLAAAPQLSAADVVVRARTLPQQAKLYRLLGDTNPLHVDPSFAHRAGFDRPILHGLCTYGFAVRMALPHIDGPLVAADARFTGVVFPGDELLLELWKTAPSRVVGRVSAPSRGVVVIEPLELSIGKADPNA